MPLWSEQTLEERCARVKAEFVAECSQCIKELEAEIQEADTKIKNLQAALDKEAEAMKRATGGTNRSSSAIEEMSRQIEDLEEAAEWTTSTLRSYADEGNYLRHLLNTLQEYAASMEHMDPVSTEGKEGFAIYEAFEAEFLRLA